LKFELACGTWPYMFPPYDAHPYTLEEVVGRLSELKFDGVELSGFKPHAHPDLYPKRPDRKDLASMIDAHKLGLAGYAADMGGHAIASPYPDVRSAYEREFEKSLQFCADMGIDAMRVDTVSGYQGVPGVSYQEAWKRVVEMFRKCSRKADDTGVQLVWEFEPGFMFNKPSEVVRLVDEVSHPGFKVMVDTCHAHCCGVGLNQTPPLDIVDVPMSRIAAELIDRLKVRIGHVHLVDSNNTLNPHNTSTHAPFGKGVIDFDAVMKAVIDAGYSGWLSLDLCFWPRAWEETEPCKKFLDELVSRHG